MTKKKPVNSDTTPREELAKAEKVWMQANTTVADSHAAGREDPPSAWLDRIKAAREGYLSYLDIAEWVYAFAYAFVRRERERLEKEMREIGEEPDEERWFVRTGAYIPQPKVPRAALKDVIRASQYLLDQGEAFERYHRHGSHWLCLECGKNLGPGKRKYCSRKCTVNYLQRRHRAKVWKGDMEKYRVDIPDSVNRDPAPLLPPPTAKLRRKV